VSSQTPPYRRWGAKLKRRALTLPMLAFVGLIGLLGAPIHLSLVFIIDAFEGEWRRKPRTRALSSFLLYLACECLGVIAAGMLWLGTAGGLLCGTTRWIQANAAIQRWWTSGLFLGLGFIFDLRLVTEGLEDAANGPYLLFVRHSSIADTLLAGALVANPHRNLFRYVLKKELLSDPCLDIVGCRLPNVFVDRQAKDKAFELDAIKTLTVGLTQREAVLIYPEGTRFSESKLKRAQKSLRAKGQPDLADLSEGFTHVLPPRTSGTLALLEGAPGLDVVILEHTGFEGSASWSSFVNGDLIGNTLRIRLRRIPAEDIPTHNREQWLFREWQKVDEWVGQNQTQADSD
jgi:1-acyl-sn-glycerol-3-phosphate acyltransferase